ncbi:MAG TPA: ROK family protein [Terriglobales bacterium]|nr:ROK family protein [Terriglobales bacterium]
MNAKGPSGQEMYAIGLDIGGTNLKAGLVDKNGQLKTALSEATPRTLDKVKVLAESFLAKLSTYGPVNAIGIGCKGVVDYKTTELVRSPGDLKHIEGHSLRDLLGPAAAGKPVYADNDARIALVAEWVWGAARGCENVLMLTLGTGVGGGLLMEGKIMRGAHGVAGHIGHMTINPYGPLCICGNYGCLETVFSARSIEAEAFSAAHRRVNSVLTDRGESWDCAQVFQVAAESDEAAKWIIDRATFHLSAAVASLIHLVDPELIIVGGQIAESGAQLLDPLRRELHRRTRFIVGRDIPIVFPRVPSHTGVIGAAGLALLETGALRG